MDSCPGISYYASFLNNLNIVDSVSYFMQADLGDY